MKKIFYVILSFCFINLHSKLSEFATKISQMPIAFCVVREDSDQDLEIIKRHFPEEKVSMLMVASGGCTAANLIANAPINDITLVDPNHAQLALSKIKIQLLNLPIKKRLEILGYLPMVQKERKSIVQGYLKVLEINEDVFPDLDLIALNGLDFEGRYEKIFEQLRIKLSDYKKEVENLFLFNDITQQANYIAQDSDFTKALDIALSDIMSQENLVKIFGQKATANRVQEFSKHFSHRIKTYLSKHLACTSPWLANMLLGNFHNNKMFPWITATFNQAMPKINYFSGFMNDVLEQAKPESYHIIHLSNIIDWCSPQEAEKTLQLAYQALKPGGAVVIRQPNSNVDIIQLNKDFEWNLKASEEFLQNDRSFFYRNFFIGFKPKECCAPKVKKLADEVLNETPIIKGSFFNDLSTMNKDTFKSAQSQFFFAVDYFSRPMAALVSRTPLHKNRIDIIHNIVEEHGDFCAAKYHSNTFKQFLNTIDISKEYLDKLQPCDAVNMFNYTLMGVCANEDPLIAIACNGIIEYAFADISALIAQKVVERNWVKKEDLVHYNLHADIDKQHAEEFFKIVEPAMNNTEQKNKVIAGLKLGAYIFNRLYEDLYTHAKLIQ